jgi:hypothetical protein
MKGGAMAETDRLRLAPSPSFNLRTDPVLALRVAIIVAVLVTWQAVGMSCRRSSPLVPRC